MPSLRPRQFQGRRVCKRRMAGSGIDDPTNIYYTQDDCPFWFCIFNADKIVAVSPLWDIA